MSVLEIAKKLNRDYNNDMLAIKADITPVYKKMPTGAFGFDYPLYGGLPYGRICTFAGKEHSGKTNAACVALSAYQRTHPDKICVYVDAEHALDIQFQARMTGLDPQKMIYVNPIRMTGEEILDAILKFQQQDDIGMIVLDSIPALQPADAIENDMTKDPGMRGTIAKSMHRFLKAMTGLVSSANNIFIMVNQVRISGKAHNGAPIYTEPGGSGPDFYSSVKVRFGTRTFIKGDKVDSSDGEGAEGYRLKFSITKHKTGPIARGGGFMSFNYDKGFMWLEDMIEIASKFDFIKKNGSYYTLINLKTNEPYLDKEDKVLKGYLKDLKAYIRENTDFQKEYIAMLNDHILATSETYGDILDAREKAEIKQQEDSVNGLKNGSVYIDENGLVVDDIETLPDKGE